MLPIDVMKNPRLKIKRANRHIDDLVGESSPLSKDLYEIKKVFHRSKVILAKPDLLDLTYMVKEPINEYFGAIIGDAVNNLRESLDYWMNNSIRCIGSSKKVQFPFASEWKLLKSSKNYSTIEKIFPEAANFIADNIRPCRDTNIFLWAATSLSNDNKHADFLPTVAVTSIDNFNLTVGGMSMSNMGFGWPADSSHIIMRVPANSNLNDDFNTNVGMTFPTGAVFDGKPVIPTLIKMSEVVSKTLDVLEEFITPYCK